MLRLLGIIPKLIVSNIEGVMLFHGKLSNFNGNYHCQYEAKNKCPRLGTKRAFKRSAVQREREREREGEREREENLLRVIHI